MKIVFSFYSQYLVGKFSWKKKITNYNAIYPLKKNGLFLLLLERLQSPYIDIPKQPPQTLLAIQPPAFSVPTPSNSLQKSDTISKLEIHYICSKALRTTHKSPFVYLITYMHPLPVHALLKHCLASSRSHKTKQIATSPHNRHAWTWQQQAEEKRNGSDDTIAVINDSCMLA